MQPQLGRVAAAIRLVEYDSCRDALAQLKRAAADHMSPYGLTELAGTDGATRSVEAGAVAGADEAASIPAPAPDYSTTNTHEAGVDEPDLVKTDGRRIVTVVDGTLRVVDVESQEVAGELTFADARDGWWYPSQLLMAGDRALILGQGSTDGFGPRTAPGAEVAEITVPWQGSRLVLVDLSESPRILSTLDLDGWYVDARLVDSEARIVLRSTPRIAWSHDHSSEDRAVEENREILATSTIDDWLPRYVHTEDGESTAGPLVKCADVSHPRRYSGASMLTVLTVDLMDGLRADQSVAVVADGQTVYGTESSLYIADDHQGMAVPVDKMTRSGQPVVEQSTEIHKFDMSGRGKPEHVASGMVDGWLLNQYSLSEYEGHLRVATVVDELPARRPVDSPATESRVTVLDERSGRLTAVGSVGGLGKGEQIYAVRFLGPVGYVVTFRQIDPLYTLDLSDPTAPRVVGELKIPGYSSYLHPAGDDRLIGVGQDADEQGMVRGSQVSLFDVTNLASPTRLDTFTMPGGWSDAEQDPHAFLYWPGAGIVVIPVWWQGEVQGGTFAPDVAKLAAAGGALVLRIDGARLAEVGVLTHVRSATGFDFPADPTIRRSLVIGDTLWTVSSSGALASDLDDLDEQAWVPFVG